MTNSQTDILINEVSNTGCIAAHLQGWFQIFQYIVVEVLQYESRFFPELSL